MYGKLESKSSKTMVKMIEREYLKIQSSMVHNGQRRHGDTESAPIKQHCTLTLFIDIALKQRTSLDFKRTLYQHVFYFFKI